ncbi:insulinase family protein [Glaciecola sp. XM2]|jgi:zinc protease|uniref:M16 family metallopeptidase n=1 Tax=Glaciecola sp. XM2 TaxID=1914931 RepID=UPI001BDE9E65|nr:pitrilysin family protein [Glaciecola sp. XM2]MBT1450904.1 insulinase family protein [Glaciecola sp. XM2]
MSKLLQVAVLALAGAVTIACTPSSTPVNTESSFHLQGDSIEHYKYTLDNGLTVVLHPDNSDPLVNLNVTYHVGSAREEYGKSGFAHFFEHMMFQGSQHVADEEHFKIITEAGGNLNGSTNSDITNYFQTVPANQLEKVLWLEADRMGFLLPAVTQAKFENQRDTVKNERAQRVDNQPYGLRFERTGEALYPKGHPYSWSTIGYVEDLERVGLDDLKAFFTRWYGPNNAVLTIGGDIDIAQTKKWIEKYFGPIPRGPEVVDAKKQPAVLEQTRYITLEDKVHLPLLQITLPTVYAGHEDEPALDVLANILGGGRTSLLYKNMVKNGLAVQAGVGHPCRELACEFQMLSLANPQNVSDLKQLSDIIAESLLEFETRGVQDDDLQRVKSSIETSTIFALQSVSGKVRTLASGETFEQTPDRVSAEVARYNSVTKQDVMRVYEQYIKDKPAVVLSVVPQGATNLAVAEQNFTLPQRNITDLKTVETSIDSPKITDTFDRSKAPLAGVNKPVILPDFWESELENGLQVVGIQTSETPTLSFVLSMEGGVLLDSLQQPGLAAFTALMMNESTENYSAEDFANALGVIGSSISVSASGRYTNVSVSTLVKNVESTMALLQERLFRPAFNEADFNRVKQQLLQSMQQQLKNPSVLAARARDAVLYGTDSRVGLPDAGTLASIESITLQDVKAFYEQYYRPDHATLVMVGDATQAQTMQNAGFMSEWHASPYDIPEFSSGEAIEKGKIFLVDNPGSVQSVVSIFKPAPTFDAFDEHFKLNLANFPLGGMFNSRINLNLREDKGYTYGASSRFVGGKNLGYFVAGADVTAEHTKASIDEFLSEIESYKANGMSADELAFLQNAYSQSDALNYETPRQKAGFLIRLLSLDLEKDYGKKQQEIIQNITTDELNQLASKWLDTSTMHIVVVGDAKSLQTQLAELNRDIVLFDVPR